MRDVITNFLRFDPQTTIPEVRYAVIGIWLLLVVVAIFSVFSQKASMSFRIAWAALVLFVPFIGLFLYCIFCLTRIDWHFLEFWQFRPQSQRRRRRKRSRRVRGRVVEGGERRPGGRRLANTAAQEASSDSTRREESD